MRKGMTKAKRIVVKIGTSTITDSKARLSPKSIKNIAKQVALLKKKGKEVILVSSGAIGAGVGELGLDKKPRDLVMKQACAAIGQGKLMEEYEKAFKKHRITTAQLLLTYDSFSKRSTYLNLRNSIAALLKLGIVPIINENDPISVDEIGATFGDNDTLSALVASKLDADLLIMMSDIEGLCGRKPRKGEKLDIIKQVTEVTSYIEKMCGSAGSMVGVGGMKTKVSAAKVTSKAGCDMIIVGGSVSNVLIKVMNGEEIGTWFVASTSKMSNKERWISLSQPKGEIIVNQCASDALNSKRSLLAVGIENVKGDFNAGDVVSVTCNGKEVLRGVSDYSRYDLLKVKGKKSEDVKKILGSKAHGVVVKRENMVNVS